MKADTINRVWIIPMILTLLLVININTAANFINFKSSNIATQLNEHILYHQIIKNINTQAIISTFKKEVSAYKNTTYYTNNFKLHNKDSGYISYASTYHITLEPGQTRTVYFSTIPYYPASFGYKTDILPSFIREFAYPVENGVWLYAVKYTVSNNLNEVKFGNYTNNYYFSSNFENITIEISIVNYHTTPALILRILNLTD
ncbi:MAG: hypothetical protein ACP5RQ_02545 [Candidatus Micrarchaeia archaeon]